MKVNTSNFFSYDFDIELPKMTPKQHTRAVVNRNLLRERLLAEGKITAEQTHAHHVCPVWRYFDIERYISYNEDDIEWLTPEEHRAVHNDWRRREREYGFLTSMLNDCEDDYINDCLLAF